MDGRSESLIKITAVEDCCMGPAAHLARWFIVAVFGRVALHKAMVAEFTL